MPSKSAKPSPSHDVTKRFGGLVAVNDMSFALAENEVLGLIGPNGSGKTTMMNLISGALRPTAGEIRLYGDDIAGVGASRIASKGVARTFQLVRMLPGLTVLENVAAGGVFGHARRWGKELNDYAHGLLRAGRAAQRRQCRGHRADLYRPETRRARPRARLPIRRCCCSTNGSPASIPTELKTGIALIEQLRAEGRTIIIVEHVMHAIRSLCDRCIVMSSGAKIAEGTPREVLADSRGDPRLSG